MFNLPKIQQIISVLFLIKKNMVLVEPPCLLDADRQTLVLICNNKSVFRSRIEICVYRFLAGLWKRFLASVTLPPWILCLLSNLPHAYLIQYIQHISCHSLKTSNCPYPSHIICHVPLAGNISLSHPIKHHHRLVIIYLSVFSVK